MADLAGPPNEQPNGISEEKKLSSYQLFILFAQISSLGFGGVLPWAYRTLVERKQLLGHAEFGELFAMGQILPGPNICNVAVILGYRHAGIAGGFAALAGIVGVPTLIVILLGLGYQHYGDVPLVRHALAGMAPVAAGLIAGTAVKLALNLPRRWKTILLVILVFGGIAIARWPLINVLGALIPLALILFWKAQRP
jgi:chromate transporter